MRAGLAQARAGHLGTIAKVRHIRFA